MDVHDASFAVMRQNGYAGYAPVSPILPALGQGIGQLLLKEKTDGPFNSEKLLGGYYWSLAGCRYWVAAFQWLEHRVLYSIQEEQSRIRARFSATTLRILDVASWKGAYDHLDREQWLGRDSSWFTDRRFSFGWRIHTSAAQIELNSPAYLIEAGRYHFWSDRRDKA
ncbi:hypothetical protein MPH_04817 [Macrophomina phaseolina MS6]|uniref:Uncharacterized protein n=1 Tax=Macrophomina phaseolina (strain MS6) TaxID=1126212 RepID=K2SMH5_MACPH|nr:hypothetical protein MPH_04817 [Macrophomina phaseolina MS6]